MASKDQAPAERADSANGTVTQLTPFQKLLRRMAQMATLDESQATPSGEDINAILTAEDEAAMWDSDDLNLYNAQKLSGCELQTFWFEVKYGAGTDSDIKTPFTTPEGKQMYLLVHSCRITEATERKDIKLPAVGAEFVWNTSARNVVGKLFWMLDHGWFDPNAERPVYFRIQGTALSGGRSIEKLKEFKGTPAIPVTAEPPF